MQCSSVCSHGIDSAKPDASSTNATISNYSKDPCPICFEDYEGDPNTIFVGVVKSCHHYFHFECLWEWLEHNSSCPLCRESACLTEADIKGTSLAYVKEHMVSNKASKCELMSARSKDNAIAEISPTQSRPQTEQEEGAASHPDTEPDTESLPISTTAFKEDSNIKHATEPEIAPPVEGQGHLNPAFVACEP